MRVRYAHPLNILVYLAVIVALLALAQGSLNNFYLRVLSTIGIYVILSASLNLTNGLTGDFSLGHAAFMSVGAYASAILTLPPATKAAMNAGLPVWLQELTLPFLVATVAGGLLAAALAVIVGVPVLRLRGHYLAVATLGLMVIVRVFANNWQPVTRGARGINGLPPHTNIWWTYAWAILTVYVVWRLVNSPYGRAMIAIREDEMAAAARGVSVFATRLLAFAIGAFFAGAAGALWAHLITAFTPNSFSFAITFNIIVMLVVGGMGSISGSVIGPVLLTLLQQALSRAETMLAVGGVPLYGLSQITVAILAILIMIFRRQGLMGGHEIRLPRLFTPLDKPSSADG
ncbi:MAG: branched-chain amino acid ABC transporter permease [Chloroflexota bacterium]|nr:branched-chain amino acid ABC transporter permease [Chloroflexota bacterium]